MKDHAQFSTPEIQTLIERLEVIMVSIKSQTTDDRDAIQEKFPTLSRHRINEIVTAPLGSDEMVEQAKQLIQTLIGKTYE